MPESERAPLSRLANSMPEMTEASVSSNPDLDRLTRLIGKTLRVPMVYILILDRRHGLIISTFGVKPVPLAKIVLPYVEAGSKVSEQAWDEMPAALYSEIAQQFGAATRLSMPLTTSWGQRLGVLCALDTQARSFSDDENVLMQDFAQLVMTEVELTLRVDELETIKAELAEKHEVLRTLIDSSPDYIFVKDTEGRFVISNRAHAQAAGIDDPDLLIGKTAFETFPAELAEQYNYDDAAVMTSGEPLINIERQTLDADGNLRWVLTSKVPLTTSDGEVRGLVGISRDITARKMAEQALRDREGFIQKVLATSAAMILIYDLQEQRNVYSSVALYEILGYTPNELLAMGDRVSVDLIHPEDYATLPNLLEQLGRLEDNRILDVEHRVRHRSGEYRWLYARHAVFKRENDGSVRQVVSTVLDVTRMKNAEAALRESEARMRALVNTAPVIFAEVDANCILRSAEGEGASRLAPDPSVFLGRNLFEMLEEDPGSDPKIAERLRNALAGEPCSFFFDNGTLVFQMRFTPTFQPNSQEVASVMIIGVDVTEQVRAQEALIEANSRLSTLRRIDTELTANLDLAHVEQTALRYCLEESNADRGFMVLANGDRLEIKAVLNHETPNPLTTMIEQEVRQALADGRMLLRTMDGKPVKTDMKSGNGMRLVLPLVYGDQPRGALVLERASSMFCNEDALEFVKSIAMRASAALENARLYGHLNQLYERVRSLEQLKTDMIRIAAHDLRNPLTGLKGYLTLLEGDMKPNMTARQQKYLTMLEESAQTMQRIISEILSLQRIEALHDHVGEYPVDLATLVKELCQRHSAQAAQKRINIELQLAPQPAIVQGDESQLREALDNLVHNALKYTPEGGQVLIRLHRHQNTIQFEVEDNGYGIPFEQQSRLFQPFFRAKTPATRNIEGTGLGLHLVKKIVERHAGQMHFRSEEGKGSIFGFVMPVYDQAQAATTAR